MKKRFNRTFLILASFCLLTVSCLPTDPEVQALLGRWILQDINSSLDESSAPFITKSKNYNGEGLFFEFDQNGNFETNTDLGLNKLLLAPGNLLRGSYDYDQTAVADYVEITIQDAQFNSDVSLIFEVVDIDSETPQLVMNTVDYITSVRQSANDLPQDIRIALYDFTDRINEARFALSFTKDE
ncbi:hypothetical protein [Jiulongibacter sp. NS-SX5]|uniref:hypothetical protein n=1 Tax=Jiulongibacter sp. NS-SX5 TaxID=3463854 RepID=UPI0040584307